MRVRISPWAPKIPPPQGVKKDKRNEGLQRKGVLLNGFEGILLHKTNAGDIVVIQDAEWQTGLTMIDNEDLFISSLDPSMLRRKVRNSYYDKRDWANKDVLVVDI